MKNYSFKFISLFILALFFLAGCKEVEKQQFDVQLRSADPAKADQKPMDTFLPGGELTGKSFEKIHIIGKSPCPDPFEPMLFSTQAFPDWRIKSNSPMLDVSPKQGRMNETFQASFNCNVDGPGVYEVYANALFEGRTEAPAPGLVDYGNKFSQGILFVVDVREE